MAALMDHNVVIKGAKASEGQCSHPVRVCGNHTITFLQILLIHRDEK